MMKRLRQSLASPVPYSVGLIVAYLLLTGSTGAAHTDGSGFALGACDVEAGDLMAGTCWEHTTAICNIGGGDNKNYCDGSTAGCLPR